MEQMQSFINNAVLFCVLLVLIPFASLIGFLMIKLIRFILNKLEL